MITYLETVSNCLQLIRNGLQPPIPMVPYLKTVCNHIYKRLGRQPLVPAVPYEETGGSNGSLFRNWIASPFPTFQYLETGGSNGSLFRNCLQPSLKRFFI